MVKIAYQSKAPDLIGIWRPYPQISRC